MCDICYLKVVLFVSNTEKVFVFLFMNPFSDQCNTDWYVSLFTCFVYCIDLCPCLIRCFTPLIVSKRNHFFLVTDGKHQHTATVQRVWDFHHGWRNGITSIALCYIWVDVLRKRVGGGQTCGYTKSASTAGTRLTIWHI